jgi:hypothetical protein
MRTLFQFIFVLLFAAHPAFAESNRAKVLREELAGADRLVVSDPEFGMPREATKPFEFHGGVKIAELITELDFDDKNSGFYCACRGDSWVTFYKGDKKIAVLSHHHGQSVRWHSDKWEGDSLFTPKAAQFWRSWFKIHGEPRFENKHLEAEREAKKEAEINSKFMASFPPKAAEIIKKSLESEEDGLISFSPQNGQGAEQVSPAAKRLAAAFPSRCELGLAVSRALGSLAQNGAGVGWWSASSQREQLVLECGRMMNGEDFEAVLKSATDDELVGAARLFFSEGLQSKIEEARRAHYAAKLARAVITKDRSRNSSSAIRELASYQSDEVLKLLAEVADGKLTGVGEAHLDEPSLKASACLALARQGDIRGADIAADLAKEAKLTEFDKAALKVAVALAGRGDLDASIFKIDSFSIAFGALEALEKKGDRASVDAIVFGGTEHMYAAIREESVLVIERLTSKKWYQNGENERAEWHGEAIRKWWRLNRDKYVPKITKKM